jgi:Glycosyltransferase sugar-binding region containing DXD motif
MAIPDRAHFCWIGASLPWAYVFAILSAADRSELGELVLHHTDTIEHDAKLRALERCPRVRLARLEPVGCLIRAGQAVGVGEELAAMYREIAAPAIRSDLLRAAILYLEGGVYLDLDTVTTASLVPLLDAPQFVGTERIVWPHFVRSSRSPALWCRSILLDVLRKAMRRAPAGWAMFRCVERLYYRGINNAVLGAEANSPLFATYLRAMAALPAERRHKLYALGPDLLQEVVQHFSGKDLTIAEPQVFYPLAPEISEHWFRVSRRVRLDAVLSRETRVVHWYASVRTRSKIAAIDPSYVRKHRDRQLYSALVCACIRNLPEAA